ncbi:LysR family transcriptional regulator [Mesorhizobium sp. STM 4661]|uniref:LysR family transcriptional regulator n=1 Tax=Mesorhizobium sp. STM 4661 TaxID=1297570 RepID=UPI0002BEA329|nr:LysR family transcriptional regulator [Mesorhizobium sp. STM 4661]CCV16476.1 putative Transcriptional regulator, LysR family [Mesorhizobium sp. STM 4661]
MSKLKQLSDLDLKLLRVFVVIVEQGSFAAAQGQLNISQSVLSENLKSLEIRLGIRLCDRGPGGFRVLPEGKDVYAAAKRLFLAVDDFKFDLASVGDGLSGELALALEDDVIVNPASRIPEALKEYVNSYGRRIKLKIEIMAGFQVLSKVADGTAQIGITVAVDRTRLRGIQSIPLFKETLRLYCSEGHELYSDNSPLAQEKIREYHYSSRGHLEPENFAGTLKAGDTEDIGLGAQAQLALILSGRNVGYVPDYIAAPYVVSGKLKQIGEVSSENDVVAAVRSKNSGLKPIEQLVRVLERVHGKQQK